MERIKAPGRVRMELDVSTMVAAEIASSLRKGADQSDGTEEVKASLYGLADAIKAGADDDGAYLIVKE